MSVLWSYIKWPIYTSAGLVTFLSSALYYYQREIIYPRNLPPGARTEVPLPTQFGIDSYEDLFLETPDHEKLHAYLIKPSNTQYARNITIMMFHGNAGNIGHRLPIARVLSTELGCNVFMLQYRGYGKSSGNPDENGINIDAQTGFNYVRERHDLKDTKLVIYGQSIGGAVGIKLAVANHENNVAGLVLENTFLSLPKLIPSVMPAAKLLAPLCHQKWASDEILPQIETIPILFLSGLRDEIVPPAHMKALYGICKAKTKVWKELPNGDHNSSVAEPGYFQYLDDFLKSYVEKR